MYIHIYGLKGSASLSKLVTLLFCENRSLLVSRSLCRKVLECLLKLSGSTPFSCIFFIWKTKCFIVLFSIVSAVAGVWGYMLDPWRRKWHIFSGCLCLKLHSWHDWWGSFGNKEPYFSWCWHQSWWIRSVAT